MKRAADWGPPAFGLDQVFFYIVLFACPFTLQ